MKLNLQRKKYEKVGTKSGKNERQYGCGCTPMQLGRGMGVKTRALIMLPIGGVCTSHGWS